MEARGRPGSDPLPRTGDVVIKDGYYAMYDRFNGSERLIGRFEIRNGIVVFASEADKWNSRILPGPVTGYTENLIKNFMSNSGETIRLEKED